MPSINFFGQEKTSEQKYRAQLDLTPLGLTKIVLPLEPNSVEDHSTNKVHYATGAWRDPLLDVESSSL